MAMVSRSGGVAQLARRAGLIAVTATMALVAGALGAVPVGAAPGDPQVTLLKGTTLPTIAPGQQFAYTLTAGCAGLQDGCVNATITDTLPAEFEISSLPPSTSERTVTYDAGTRVLTITFKLRLNQPAGAFGLPAGASKQIQIGMRLPAETSVTNGQIISNSANFVASNAVQVSSSVDMTADVPVVVRPVATKAWSPSTAIAQSGGASTAILGVRNASSSSADVRELVVTDHTAATFNAFDVTALGPVTYPPGADQVVVSVCTKPVATPCVGGEWVSATHTGAGPFAAPGGTPLDSVTGVEFAFSSSTNATLPYSATQGTAAVGLVLRDTDRTTSNSIQPQSNLVITNNADPSAIDASEVVTTGTPAAAKFTIQPDTVVVQAAKKMYADNNASWTSNGFVVVGRDSGVSMEIDATNGSAGPLKTLEIVEQSPSSAQSEFAKIDATNGRFSWPTGATTASLVVTCRSGSDPGPVDYVRAGSPAVVAISGFGCDAGVHPEQVKIVFTGENDQGEGTIAAGAVAGLDLHGIAAGVTAGDVTDGLVNCARAAGSTPSSASAAAIACQTVVVANPTPGMGSINKSSSGVQTIVPGQPMKFSLGFRNTGNIPMEDAFVYDPTDPGSSPIPFDTVRISKITTTATPAHTIELWDPTVNDYVPYVSSNTALLTRSRGFRVLLTDPLPVGASFSISLTVMVRDGVPLSTQFTNCAQFGFAGTPVSTKCAPQTTVVGGGATSASLDKLFAQSQVIRPEPGLPPQVITVKHRLSNDGPLYLKRLLFTDIDPAFFDSVTFKGTMHVNFPPGSNRVQVDVCTTGCSDSPTTWITGTPTASTTPGLPAGAVAADVEGIRVTFTNSSSGYELLPTTNFPTGGSCPSSTFCFDVTAREFLRSNSATPIPSTITDATTGAGESALQAAGTTFPIPEVSTDIPVVQGTAQLKLTKGPESRIAPGDIAPFDLTLENTGTTAVVDPVITDPLPTELTLDEDASGGASGRPFVISYPELPAGYPTLPSADVEYLATPDGVDPNRIAQVTWTFTGWTLPPGGKVSIRIYVKLTPGTLADTTITNTAGAKGSNDVLTCAPGSATASGAPYGDGTFCLASADVVSLEGNDMSATKWSAGPDGGDLYLSTTGEVVDPSDSRCPSLISAGLRYTRYPCAPIVAPGGSIEFIAVLVNSGTNALRDIVLVDGLPVQGDTGVLLSGTQRGTQWSAPPTMLTPVVELEGYSGVTTDYTDAAFPGFCTQNLQPAPGDTCSPDPFTDPESQSTTGFRTTMDFTADGLLQPGESVTLAWSMAAPVSLTANDVTELAWNSFAYKPTFIASDGHTPVELPATEPPKAGAAMRFNTVDVTKAVDGTPPAGVTTTYEMGYSCVSGSTTVASGTLNVDVDAMASLPFVPVGATCSVWENTTDGGSSPNQGEANAVTVEVPDIGADGDIIPVVDITNSFESGQLILLKSVAGSAATTAVSGGGTLATRTYPVEVECAYPADSGQPLPGFPLTRSLTPGTAVTIDVAHGTPLPAGSVCSVAETATNGASSTTVSGTDSGTVSGTAIEVTVLSGDEGGTTVTVANRFDPGYLTVSKKVTGVAPAGVTYPVTVSCTTGPSPVLTLATRSLNLKAGSSQKIAVPGGSTCTVRETNRRGATSVKYADSDHGTDGKVLVATSKTASVALTNAFPTACTLTVVALPAGKTITRKGATRLITSAKSGNGCITVMGAGGSQLVGNGVRCRPTGLSVAGDLRYCRATVGVGNSVTVTTLGYANLLVRVTITSRPPAGSKLKATVFTRQWRVV